MDENFERAVPITNVSKPMSSQEFQDFLTSWYEEKGILSNLRTQLRFKMINVLKNTAIGRDITRKTSQASISLSKQAINLIVAEFLLKNKCDYSLSIFNTEAGLVNTYSESLVNENGRLSLQFDKENIVNILELIGINKNSELCNFILSIYYENNENVSLLSCLINILSNPSIERNLEHLDIKQKCHIDLSHETDYIRQIGTVLMDSHMPINNILHLIEMIKCLHKSEITHLEDNYNNTIDNLKKSLVSKDKQIEHLDKKKKLGELKLIKIMGDFNALRHHMKTVIKDRLLKEKEIKKLRDKNQIKPLEGKTSEEKIIFCKLEHCDNICKENNKQLTKLKNDNEELYTKNLSQMEEINELRKKYTDLLQEFYFLQKKVSLINMKVNEEKPSSQLNLNSKEVDIKHINNEKSNKKFNTDSSDSVTEDILKEAWERLEQLEKESKEIEDQYEGY